MKNNVILLSTLLVGALAIAGCKKGSGQAQTIELPEGQLHVAAQWVDGQLWVESFDPATRVCSFSQYRDGKPVENKTVTFTNCRTGLGGPMMRPMMERRQMPGREGMMMRPDMPPHPGRVRPNTEQPPMTPPPAAQSEPAPVAPPPQG
ncbi:MAG TPA: hypothetical protein PKZ68_00375 [Pseudomonadales bacterium]|nr:hypothetical protein [Pseudomonadales bacterium]HNI36726.1 hypothetical protein [Pseudomonadales bacterium]HNN87627.1 hypothetical protein [Pseudomonadales bacterium]